MRQRCESHPEPRQPHPGPPQHRTSNWLAVCGRGTRKTETGGVAGQNFHQPNLCQLKQSCEHKKLRGVKNAAEDLDTLTEHAHQHEDAAGPEAEHAVEERELKLRRLFLSHYSSCHTVTMALAPGQGFAQVPLLNP